MWNTLRNILKSTAKKAGLTKLFLTTYAKLQEPDMTLLLKNNKVFAEFTDAKGNHHALVSGLRDSVVPNWRKMVNPAPVVASPSSTKSMALKLETWSMNLSRVQNLLKTFSFSFSGMEVLEIGAHDGATAFALALIGAKRVLAVDMAAYYLTQTPGGEVTEQTISEKNAELAGLRNAYAKVVGQEVAGRVSFQEDDICSSLVPSSSMDIMVSFEVLEHLTHPWAAFREMARILKPGGIAFHEYNPFFSFNGGHSLCTLDFPWGHVRLDAKDFRKYVENMRPNEKDVAISFYDNNLNRMTIYQLTNFLQKEGLRPLSILPFCSKEHLSLMTQEAFSQCQRIYPSTEIVDLISPSIWVLVKKDDRPA